MLTGLLRLFGFKRRRSRQSSDSALRPKAKYDAAQSGTLNVNHWRNADSLSPDGAANADVRKALRERARYEAANNSFAAGACNAISEDAIGTGARLQIIGQSEDVARLIESSFQRWSDETGLADKLRLLYRAGAVDGESFALVIDNPTLRHRVKIDLMPIEADRVTDPTFFVAGINRGHVDGIKYDAAGNPTEYTVLREHPGDMAGFAPQDFDTFGASEVFHWYRGDRPGQSRGVSWLTPALPLFAQLRRYTLAVLTGAELAANLAGILKTDLPPGDDAEPIQITAMEEVEIPRGALMTLPPGWDATQLDAKQPMQNFGDFRTQILVEIGRALEMPLNRITGNSSGYNYSSGRLDHLGYHRSIWLQRDRLRLVILDRLFRLWLDEAMLAGELPEGLPPFAEWEWDWQWDAFGDIDPLKEASASEKLLGLNLTDLAEQCAARGRRWDQVLRQRAREQQLIHSLGLQSATIATAAPPAEVDDEAIEDTDVEEEVPANE